MFETLIKLLDNNQSPEELRYFLIEEDLSYSLKNEVEYERNLIEEF